MHIVVCVKQVPNPEAASSMFKVDEQSLKVIPAAGLQLVMSPFDEQAIEAALRVREGGVDAKITAMCIGPDSARSVLKHALAMGADEAVLVSEEAFIEAGSEVTAWVLARTIEHLESVDLVLTGRQAADWDAGVVGSLVAEELNFPVLTFACRIAVAERTVQADRVLADGIETIEADLPAVVTVSNEIGAARVPSLRETMRAARKPLVVRSAGDIGLDSARIASLKAKRVRERLYVPSKESRCELIVGDDGAAQGAALGLRLIEARLV
jgi:electron transfer flavoprotein beta subunit